MPNYQRYCEHSPSDGEEQLCVSRSDPKLSGRVQAAELTGRESALTLVAAAQQQQLALAVALEQAAERLRCPAYRLPARPVQARPEEQAYQPAPAYQLQAQAAQA